jgi:hypothetical protein
VHVHASRHRSSGPIGHTSDCSVTRRRHRGHTCALPRCLEDTYHLAHARHVASVQRSCSPEYTAVVIGGTRVDAVVC